MDSELQLTNFRVVGHGGFSTVYVADQELLGRQVAVKVLRSSFDDDATWQQFLRECQASGQLSNHPGVVTVYDASRTRDGRGYIVMEFLKHGALSGWIKREGTLGQDHAAAVGVSIASALQAAHAAGIRHRDVKPANLLIGEDGQAKLGDFGISRVNSMSSSTTKSYTPEHVSPEVLRGESSTFSSDLYSLASTLYQLVEGHSPYARSTDESPGSLLVRKVTEPAPNMSTRTDPSFSSLIMAGLSPNPDGRPLLAEFSRALLDLPQQSLFARGAAPTPPALGTIERSPLTLSSVGDETTVQRRVLSTPVAVVADDATVMRIKAPTAASAPEAVASVQGNKGKWAALAIAAVSILGLGGFGIAKALSSGSRASAGTSATTIGKTDPTSAGSTAQAGSSQVATTAIPTASTAAAPTSADVTAGSAVAPTSAQSGGTVAQTGGGASNTGGSVVLGNTVNPTPGNPANPTPGSTPNPAPVAPVSPTPVAPVTPTPAAPTPVAPTPVPTSRPWSLGGFHDAGGHLLVASSYPTCWYHTSISISPAVNGQSQFDSGSECNSSGPNSGQLANGAGVAGTTYTVTMTITSNGLSDAEGGRNQSGATTQSAQTSVTIPPAAPTSRPWSLGGFHDAGGHLLVLSSYPTCWYHTSISISPAVNGRSQFDSGSECNSSGPISGQLANGAGVAGTTYTVTMTITSNGLSDAEGGRNQSGTIMQSTQVTVKA